MEYSDKLAEAKKAKSLEDFVNVYGGVYAKEQEALVQRMLNAGMSSKDVHDFMYAVAKYVKGVK